MKKIGYFILAIIIFGIILYVTFVIAVIEIIVGAVLLVIAAILLWMGYRKIKHKLD